ncbi:MAG: transcriptional regulator [Crocosphaera sp.]|nr:transcriptional regulator [Crocosphaera sp.]
MPVKNYRDDLLKRLCDPNYSSQYLKAALDETLKDGNQEAFLLALKNIIEAKLSVNDIAKNTDYLQKKSVNCSLDQEPLTLENLLFVLHSVGLTIDFKPILD